MPVFRLPVRRITRFLSALVMIGAIAACGETVDGTTSTAASATATARSASTKQTTTPNWVACAQEGGLCSFAGTRAVRYGTQTLNVTATYTGQVSCTNGVFGDPSPGFLKSCWYAADPDANGSNWVSCAIESQFCAFTGTTSVRFGANASYVTSTYTNGVSCTTAVFGDPAYGVGKTCDYLATSNAGSDSTGWTLCAQENQTCSFTGTRSVRYGTQTQNVTESFTGQTSCANSVFGDPVPGVQKSCWYSSDPNTTSVNWVSCAAESQFCAFSGTATVRFGAGTSYASGTFTNGVSCANAIFGDPTIGVGKSCAYMLLAQAASSAPTGPNITVQPQPVVASSGQTATFTVTATSSDTMTYQWSRNGTAISGGNDSSYTIVATQLADTGAVFKVAVTNSGGTTTSSGAGLTVNAVVSSGPTAQRPFSDRSPWNARPTQYTLGSDRIPASTYFPFIGTGAYSATAAIASTTDAPMSVAALSGSSGIWIADAEVYAPTIVIPHWPANVVAAQGSDGHADIIDVANNKIHAFWQLSRGSDGVWRAAQYGWTALDGTGWSTPGQYMQGSRAVGVVSSAGLIRVDEVNDGKPMYQHALAMSLTFNGLSASPTWIFPATAADGNAATTNTGRIPEGARVMLPAGFDTSAITDPALLKVVRTLKNYGAYVVDRNYGTPYLIYAENGSNFNLMPNGWDETIANQLQAIRAALAPIGQVTQWVDATGTIFTPETNLNLLSMRGSWYADVGRVAGTFDSWQQAVVFPGNGVVTSQVNTGGRSVPSFITATPAPGTRFRVRVSASDGAAMRLSINKMGSSFDTGVMHDGDEVVLTWPSGATGAFATLRASSGPQGGGKVSGTMVRLD